MRVVVVAAWPPWPPTDGASLVLRHHLRHLAADHDLLVLAASRPPGAAMPDMAWLPEGVELRWFGPSRQGAREYARRRLASVRTGEPADVYRVEVPPLMEALDRALDDHRPDVLHLFGAGTAQLAARADGVPAVHVAVDPWSAAYGSHEMLPGWRRLIERGQHRKVLRHERRHLPRCHAVVVVAPADAQTLRAALPQANVVVVPNGVDVGPPPTPMTDEPVLGFHGALCTPVNVAAARVLARDVLPRIRAHGVAARVELIGRDPAPEVAALAGPDVEVTGAVPDVRARLDRVAVYVAPLVSGTGIKNKVLEAMAAGLPVVATTRALDGIGAGPGVLARDGAPAIAEATVRLLDKRADRIRMGAEARARAEAWPTWEEGADAIAELWARAARAAHRR